MESQTPNEAANEQLAALADAERAAAHSAVQAPSRWVAGIAALLGPVVVAIEARPGALTWMAMAILLAGLTVLAFRDSRKSRVRKFGWQMPRPYARAQFGLVFGLVMGLQVLPRLVDEMHNGLLAAVSYVVLAVYFDVWFNLSGRLLADPSGSSDTV